MKKKFIIIALSCFLICSLTAILLTAVSGFNGFVEKSHRVEANILIIESWLSDFAIDLAKKEISEGQYDYIVTTGIRSPELDFCMVAMNGYLIFYPRLLIKSNLSGGEAMGHLIEVVARSKMGGKYNSHFNVWVNDSIVADFSADDKPRRYGFVWNGAPDKIDSLMVQFTNDLVDSGGDRNLYVKEIAIDNKLIIPYQFNSVFDPGLIGGSDRVLNNYLSHPELIRNRLIKSGADPARVIAITGKRTNINRTLVSALAFRSWLKSSGIRITGVNIVTMETHSRRTWTTYRAILDNSIKTGVISIPDSAAPATEKTGFIKRLTESLDLIYYDIILIPYRLSR